MTTLSPPHLLALSCMITLHWSLPLSVPICLPCPCLLHVESLANVPQLDNFYPVHQKTAESFRTSATSPDPATASTVRDIIKSGTAVPQPTLEYSIPAPSLPSTSAPAAIALRQNAIMPSDSPNTPSPPSSYQVPSILPTGAPLSSLVPMTRSYLSLSFQESHHPIIATAVPSSSPGRTSAPDLGVTAEGSGHYAHLKPSTTTPITTVAY
ncbi:hypothetical protein EDB87DRAFT_1637532 [Lactarius vividus]|nr:hypothetical protein EDB87DRAFT_1637532 [Lactarius vividus]